MRQNGFPANVPTRNIRKEGGKVLVLHRASGSFPCTRLGRQEAALAQAWPEPGRPHGAAQASGLRLAIPLRLCLLVLLSHEI